MIEEIKNKLKNDINCVLSIEELKTLYEIDSDYDMSNYRKKRDMYHDLVKIFGSDKVAQNLDSINHDTVVFIGNIIVFSFIPIYNLRYIYGDINYFNDVLLPIDNIEKVFGELLLNSKLLDNYSNLEYANTITINDLNNVVLPNYLDTLKYTGKAIIYNSFPSNLKKICLNGISDCKNIDVNWPSSLEELEMEVISCIDNNFLKKLPNSIKKICLGQVIDFKNIEIPSYIKELIICSSLIYNLKLPKNLKICKLPHLRKIVSLKCNDELEQLSLNDINNATLIKLNHKLKKLYIGYTDSENLSKLNYPSHLELLSLTSSFYHIKLVNVNLENMIKYSIVLPEYIIQLYKGGLKTIDELITSTDILNYFSKEEISYKCEDETYEINCFKSKKYFKKK